MANSISIEEKHEQDSTIDKSIRCRNCEHKITEPNCAVKPFEHTFRNPAAYSFHVICYSEAAGAVSVGDATAEASWFAGYEWTFAICGKCHNHIGWWYIGKSTFAGLIATRLIR